MKNKKILICDDDQDNLDVLEILLVMEGFTVIKERESTKLLKRINEVLPDLVLLDLWMPVISGDEIIKKIRADVSSRDLIVIVFSASFGGKEIAIEAGANDYIEKPYDINEITRIITEYLA